MIRCVERLHLSLEDPRSAIRKVSVINFDSICVFLFTRIHGSRIPYPMVDSGVVTDEGDWAGNLTICGGSAFCEQPVS